MILAQHPFIAGIVSTRSPTGQQARQGPNARVSLDNTVEAAQFASVFVWIIDRPYELPVALTIMHNAHNGRVVLNDAPAHENALMRIIGEGPLCRGKPVALNMGHHSSRKQAFLIQQWLRPGAPGAAAGGVALTRKARSAFAHNPLDAEIIDVLRWSAGAP